MHKTVRNSLTKSLVFMNYNDSALKEAKEWMCFKICVMLTSCVTVSRYRRRKQNCPNCNYSWCENIKDSNMKLRKVRNLQPLHCSVTKRVRCGPDLLWTLQVDFIWINRDQRSFEWFVSLLTRLEMDQADEEPEGEKKPTCRETVRKEKRLWWTSVVCQVASWKCTCTWRRHSVRMTWRPLACKWLWTFWPRRRRETPSLDWGPEPSLVDQSGGRWGHAVFQGFSNVIKQEKCSTDDANHYFHCQFIYGFFKLKLRWATFLVLLGKDYKITFRHVVTEVFRETRLRPLGSIFRL